MWVASLYKNFVPKQLALLTSAFGLFQDLFIPITFRTAEGSLHAIPEKFLFEKVFPVSNFQGFFILSQSCQPFSI